MIIEIFRNSIPLFNKTDRNYTNVTKNTDGFFLQNKISAPVLLLLGAPFRLLQLGQKHNNIRANQTLVQLYHSSSSKLGDGTIRRVTVNGPTVNILTSLMALRLMINCLLEVSGHLSGFPPNRSSGQVAGNLINPISQMVRLVRRYE